MNKRARNRLIGVTVIILAIIAGIFFGMSGQQGAMFKTVAEISKDPSLVGKRVQVGGAVVSGSWDKKTRPMRFSIQDQNTQGGPHLAIVYGGNVPNTFGDGVVAIVTGTLAQGDVIEASELVVKCPEKSASRTTALPLADLLAKTKELTGKPVQVTGYVVAGSIKAAGGEERFKIQTEKSGGPSVSVLFDGGLPAGVTDGAPVVLGGSLDPSGTFDASSVSLAK